MAIKDKDALRTQLQVLFPDNNTGDITPERLRQQILDMVDSDLNQTVYDGNEIGIVTAAEVNVIPLLKNSPGSIPRGRLVHVDGAQGVEMTDKTFATNRVVGITIEEVTDTVPGNVLFAGYVTGLDTSGFAVEDILYVGPTPGVPTNVPPSEGEKLQVIGGVTKVDAVNGEIVFIPSDIKNSPSLFIDYDPTGDSIITALNVQSGMKELDSALTQALSYWYDESDAVDVNLTTTFAVKASISENLPAGTYRAEYGAEATTDNVNRTIEVEFRYNATTINMVEHQPTSAGNYASICGFKHIVHAGGPLSLDVRFRLLNDAGGPTASIRNTRISLKPA